MLGIGLGLKAKIYDLGLESEVLGLVARGFGLGLATCHLPPGRGLVLYGICLVPFPC